MKSNEIKIEKTSKPARIGAAPKKTAKINKKKYMTCDEFRKILHDAVDELYGITK